MPKLTFTHSTKLRATPETGSTVLMTLPAKAIVDTEETSAVILQKMGNGREVIKVVAMGIHGWCSAKYARFAGDGNG